MVSKSFNRRGLLLSAVAIAALGAAPAFAQTAAPATAQAQPATTIPVVATFSILADFVKQVGGERVAVTTLVAAGADAHVYSPTPADARALAGARLVFVNGLGFEGWVNRLIRSSGTRATVVTASAGVRPLKAEKGGHDHGHGHSHGENDPHAWQSVANVRLYVETIRAALAAADAAGAEVYGANARRYLASLDELENEIRSSIARIPADRRRIITAHDAFQYFEKAYGVDFVSPRGVSTAAEPSPQQIARIIQQIRRDKIPAVFLENISDPRLIKRIADETGARIGGTLYSDALTPAGGPASTYIDLMRHNVRQLVGALVVS